MTTATPTTSILCHHGRTIDSCSICQQQKHAQIVSNLDTLLADARPRLLRIAELNGIPRDAADDIAQDTLVVAWRHLDNLHTPERFSAWLDGICRNVCKRYARAQSAPSSHALSLSEISHDDIHGPEGAASFAIADPGALDPLEELNREDMAALLDRALAYLPGETRELIELCYLAELPQREAAERLQLTIGALELRLHRARRLLRQVLNGKLRAEAEAFGLVDPEQSSGWREMRQWCWLCGKHRMRGIFEQQPGGQISLRVRCPDCSNRYDIDIMNTAGLIPMSGLQSFRPAIKRALQVLPHIYNSSKLEGICPLCKASIRRNIIADTIPSVNLSIPGRIWLVSHCDNCGLCATDVVSLLISDPEVMNFILYRNRIVSEPATRTEYGGQQVICECLTDVTSAERLTILVDAKTLQIVARFKE